MSKIQGNRHKQKGVTLIELIISIVVITIALAGVLSVFNHSVAKSADPLIQHQALAIAESYLEEILSKEYMRTSDNCSAVVTVRSEYCSVDDYHDINEPPTNMLGDLIAPLAQYNVTVQVTPVSLGGVAAKRISVRVTHPAGVNLSLKSYRTLF